MNATFAPVAPVRAASGSRPSPVASASSCWRGPRSLDLGVSTFVSLGNKADVSGNDLLQYWEEDPDTDVILLYLESFGNPRKFARTRPPHRTHEADPGVEERAHAAGARGAASHTAALANPDVAVDELFRQAGVDPGRHPRGVVRHRRLFVHQPLPDGRRVAIVSNGGGPGILATDACVGAGSRSPSCRPRCSRPFVPFAPLGAGVQNPVDLIASAGADVYERALPSVLGSGEVDALS